MSGRRYWLSEPRARHIALLVLFAVMFFALMTVWGFFFGYQIRMLRFEGRDNLPGIAAFLAFMAALGGLYLASAFSKFVFQILTAVWTVLTALVVLPMLPGIYHTPAYAFPVLGLGIALYSPFIVYIILRIVIGRRPGAPSNDEPAQEQTGDRES